MTDPLRAEIERLAREWAQYAEAVWEEIPHTARDYDKHAADLRRALRSTEGEPCDFEDCVLRMDHVGPHQPEPEGGGRAGAQVNPSLARRLGRAAPEEAATLPKRSACPLTGDALKDACRRLSPPPALEDMDIATPEEAATGTPNSKETTP